MSQLSQQEKVTPIWRQQTDWSHYQNGSFFRKNNNKTATRTAHPVTTVLRPDPDNSPP